MIAHTVWKPCILGTTFVSSKTEGPSAEIPTRPTWIFNCQAGGYPVRDIPEFGTQYQASL
jgi:hypothetical protein